MSMPRRPSSTTSSARRRPTRQSGGSRTSHPSAAPSSATRRARRSRCRRPAAARSSSRSWRSRRPDARLGRCARTGLSRSSGFQPMPTQHVPAKRFPDRDEIAAVRDECEPLEAGQSADTIRRIAGRAMARRDMGRLVFLDVVDRTGRVQVICEAAKTGEIDVLLGDVVAVTGHPGRARRGEPSLLADSVEVLSRNTQPLPDTFHGLTDVELRYRKRYLDLLVNEETREAFMLRARIVSAVRAYLDGEGFVEVETPVLQPRYGGAFARPFVTHHNELDRDLYLRIATELYLKRLIVGGLERVYELGKDFRNEGVSFKHNPEFTMVEWYEAYADYTDEMRRVEEMVAFVAQEAGYTGDIDFTPPWPRVTLREAIHAKTGVDILEN